MEEFKGLPGISEYLSSRGDGCPVQVSELEHMVDEIMAYTGFTKELSERILALFFQEIRTALLNDEGVNIRSLGAFSKSRLRTIKNRTRIQLRFIPKKSLINRLKSNG